MENPHYFEIQSRPILTEIVSKIHGCEIQDISTNISIEFKLMVTEEEEENVDKSDKHLEAIA